MEENYSEACGIHESPSGEKGVYRSFKVRSDTYDAETADAGVSDVMMWSCCGRQHVDAPPCAFRHHQFKEKMLQINALANPKTSVENVDVTVLTELDISVFAGSDYDLKLQISKSLTTVFYSYFDLGVPIEAVEEDKAVEDEDAAVDSSKPLDISLLKKTTRYNLKSVHFGGPKSNSKIDTDTDLSSVARHQLLELDPEYATPGTNELIRGGATTAHKGRYDAAGFPIINSRTRHDAAISGSGNGLPVLEGDLGISAPKSMAPKKTGFMGFFSRSPAIRKSGTSIKNAGYSAKSARQTETAQGADAPPSQDARILPVGSSSQPSETTNAGDASKIATAKEVDTNLEAKTASSGQMHDPAHPADVTNAATTTAITTTTTSTTTGTSSDAVIPAVDTRHEIVYVRRLRMGALKASINTSGFTFNVTNLRAEIDTLTIHGEALGWQQLINRLLYHAAWSVARHAKTSTLVASLFTWSSTVPVGPALIASAADHDDSGGDSDDERYKYASNGAEVQAEDENGRDSSSIFATDTGRSTATVPAKGKTFLSIPIPFSSRWAAMRSTSPTDPHKSSHVYSSTSSSSSRSSSKKEDPGAADDPQGPPPPAGWAPYSSAKATPRRTLSHDKLESGASASGTTLATSHAHRKEMAKLMGKWKR